MDTTVSTAAETAPESCWVAVANIIRERHYGPGGAEIRYGTKHFAPGAKVYIVDWYGGMCQRIVVVGLQRKSKRYITLTIDVRLVDNLRPKVCYDPMVIAKFKEHYHSKPYGRSHYTDWLTKEFAETVCQTVPHWQQKFKLKAPEVKLSADEVESRRPHPFLSWLPRFFSFLFEN